MVERHEQVAREQGSGDGMEQCRDGAVALACEVCREVGLIAAATEIAGCPELGLGVGVDAGPPGANAVAPEGHCPHGFVGI